MSQANGWKIFRREWWLLTANRRIVALTLALGIFVCLVASASFASASIGELLKSSDPIETLFQGLIGAILTGVTLVLTINQLVLSQELGGLADQRGRMEGAMSFFDNIESRLDVPVTSVDPAKFLCSLLRGIDNRAARLEEQDISVSHDGNDFSEMVEDVRTEAKNVIGYLQDTRFGTFEVVSAVLNFNYSRHLNRFRAVEASMKKQPGEDPDEFEELVSLLEAFGPAREHIKTLYFQWDLIKLSKDIIFTGVPALLVSCWPVLYLNEPGLIAGSMVGISNLLLIVSLLVTLSFVPFLVLVSYVTRVATVAQRTLAIGPLLLND